MTACNGTPIRLYNWCQPGLIHCSGSFARKWILNEYPETAVVEPGTLETALEEMKAGE